MHLSKLPKQHSHLGTAPQTQWSCTCAAVARGLTLIARSDYSSLPRHMNLEEEQVESWKEPGACDTKESLFVSDQLTPISHHHTPYPESFTMTSPRSIPSAPSFLPDPSPTIPGMKITTSIFPSIQCCFDLRHLHVNILCGICNKEVEEESHCMISTCECIRSTSAMP